MKQKVNLVPSVNLAGVELTTDLPLPSLIKKSLKIKAGEFLDKHWHKFGAATLHLHIKRVGSRVGCYAHLFSDQGSYHAFSDDWDVRRAAKDALLALENQFNRKMEKQTQLYT